MNTLTATHNLSPLSRSASVSWVQVVRLCLCLPLLIAGLTTPLSCGCTNTPGRVLATTVQTADSAMQGWATYVALGKATADQETDVRSAYGKYQASVSAAEAAYVAAAKTGDDSIWKQASEALRASQRELLALVNQFQQSTP